MYPSWALRLAVGLVAGAVIAGIDAFAFGGEVSPIVIVSLLLLATTAVAGLWGRAGRLAAAAAWVCLPLGHLVRHVLGLPDTVQPNTYASILLLAAFTFVIAVLGTGAGMLIHAKVR